MGVGVAEHLVEHVDAPQVVPDGVFLCHADAAVKLDRAERHVACVAGDGELRAMQVGGHCLPRWHRLPATAAAMAMLRAISRLTSISDARWRSAWFSPIRRPNCFACAQVVHREIEGGLGGAAHVGAHGGDASGHGALDGETRASRIFGLANGCAAACVSTSSPAAVSSTRRNSRSATPASLASTRNSAPVRVSRCTGDARAHDEVPRQTSGGHVGLDAVELPAAVLAFGTRLHPQRRVTAGGFVMRPGRHDLAAGHAGQQSCLHRLVGAEAQGGACEHRARQERLHRERAAEGLHRGQQVARTATEAAECFWHWQRCQAQLGQSSPGLFVMRCAGGGERTALSNP